MPMTTTYSPTTNRDQRPIREPTASPTVTQGCPELRSYTRVSAAQSVGPRGGKRQVNRQDHYLRRQPDTLIKKRSDGTTSSCAAC
jgi:hypothetical protein